MGKWITRSICIISLGNRVIKYQGWYNFIVENAKFSEINWNRTFTIGRLEASLWPPIPSCGEGPQGGWNADIFLKVPNLFSTLVTNLITLHSPPTHCLNIFWFFFYYTESYKLSRIISPWTTIITFTLKDSYVHFPVTAIELRT